MAFKATEKAVLAVNGRKFEDWTSVTVVHRYTEAFPIFTFECTESVSEQAPRKNFREVLQFKPGDACTIMLAGQLAVTGYITTRQAAYDAENHGVQLVGKGKTWDLASSSVETENGKFDGYPWEAIARKLIAPFGIKLETVGAVDKTPFPEMSVQPGELVWAALERLARDRKIVLGSTERGNLLAIGDHGATSSDKLIEGRNILRAGGTIQDDYVYQKYWTLGQRAGHDSAWGDDVSRIRAMAPGSATRYRPLVNIAEHPDTPEGLKKRSEFDALFHEGALIQAQVTVQGWLRPGGGLWKVGTYPHLESPMLLIDQPLGIREATFIQNDKVGTITTLDLVAPWFMNGRLDWSGGAAPPGPGQIVP